MSLFGHVPSIQDNKFAIPMYQDIKCTQNIKSTMHIFYFSVHWGTIWCTTTIYNARHWQNSECSTSCRYICCQFTEWCCTTEETAKSYCTKVPHIIQCNFSNTIIDVGKKVPGYEEIPPPVLNVFLEYGNRYIHSKGLLPNFVSNFQQVSYQYF